MHSMTMQMSVQMAIWAVGEAQGLFRALRRRWRERRTAAALHELDDATLKDLGLHRCEIPSIARARCAEPGRP
jgi:uncharacterized protein YjiS (DUF1127 family)